MSARPFHRVHTERGVGLMEVMISIVIGMLLVLVIYQVYEISESQKRTITSGSDAQQNASYGLYVLGRDVSMAGNGIASTALSLETSSAPLRPCALLRPIPVLITAGADANTPDTITVLYGGSSALSTAVSFKQSATVSAGAAQPYVVPGPMGFTADPADATKSDLIAAVQGVNCTISQINAGGVNVDPATGFATISHTPVAGDMAMNYTSGVALLVNLGPAASMGRIEYTVDTTGHALRTQNRLPTDGPVNPIINDVVNLKAQYGVDANCNGVLTWVPVPPAGAWSAADVQALPLPIPPSSTGPFCVAGTPSLRQIQAIRIAIVTRSAQYEKDVVTPQYPPNMGGTQGQLGMFCDAASVCPVRMNLTTDDQHYRYKVLETAIPLRNALWNGQ